MVPIRLHNMQGLPSISPVDSPRTSSPFVDRHNDTSSVMDVDVITLHTNCDNHLGSDLLDPPFNQINNNPAEETHEEVACQGGTSDNQEEFPDEDELAGDQDLECGDEIHNYAISPPSEPTEDTLDPFVVDRHPIQSNVNISAIPDHLLVIYAMVCWLHMQFSLPRIACNAVLAILACLVTLFDPQMTSPFITLPSIMRTLAVDPTIELLPICPNCREVFPSAASRHVQDACASCRVPLFLPIHTNRGNARNVKTPVIKYPYLSLSQQLMSVLKLPGIEKLLDNWRHKPRKSGEYSDIFDGDMCRVHLKAPDGSIFFSNLPHESQGPDGELRLGVNLGVDWYVILPLRVVLTHFFATGSLTYAVISPHPIHRVLLLFRYATSHLSIGEFSYVSNVTVDTPFSLSRYRTSNLLCTSILPGPKEQNPDEIQRFLRPIISDLLRLWKDGIKVPTESRPEGEAYTVILHGRE